MSGRQVGARDCTLATPGPKGNRGLPCPPQCRQRTPRAGSRQVAPPPPPPPVPLSVLPSFAASFPAAHAPLRCDDGPVPPEDRFSQDQFQEIPTRSGRRRARPRQRPLVGSRILLCAGSRGRPGSSWEASHLLSRRSARSQALPRVLRLGELRLRPSEKHRGRCVPLQPWLKCCQILFPHPSTLQSCF